MLRPPPPLWISYNDSMIFYNKIFDKTMQIFDHQRLTKKKKSLILETR